MGKKLIEFGEWWTDKLQWVYNPFKWGHAIANARQRRREMAEKNTTHQRQLEEERSQRIAKQEELRERERLRLQEKERLMLQERERLRLAEQKRLKRR